MNTFMNSIYLPIQFIKCYVLNIIFFVFESIIFLFFIRPKGVSVVTECYINLLSRAYLYYIYFIIGRRIKKNINLKTWIYAFFISLIILLTYVFKIIDMSMRNKIIIDFFSILSIFLPMIIWLCLFGGYKYQKRTKYNEKNKEEP